MIKKQRLEKFLSKHFIRYSLIPILVVEVALLVMYFSINSYISSKNINLLLGEAQSHSQAILENEATFISEKYIITNKRKETINPPKKFFLFRWFQRKHWVMEVYIKEKNPYIKEINNKFVEIIE